jgi:hypothetical protein
MDAHPTGVTRNSQSFPEVYSMRVDPKPVNPHKPGRLSPRILTFVFVVALTVVVFLLARTMVLHNFYRGGAQDPNQSLEQ